MRQVNNYQVIGILIGTIGFSGGIAGVISNQAIAQTTAQTSVINYQITVNSDRDGEVQPAPTTPARSPGWRRMASAWRASNTAWRPIPHNHAYLDTKRDRQGHLL